MTEKAIEEIKSILLSSQDNQVLISNNGEWLVQEIPPYGKVEITSHDNKIKQVTVTKNHRL
ncbi:hypothetical protein ACFOU0_06620 [Salinicoccus sesuvii]|uniref:Phage protein n=1 Tax=Salinicoccus sesuvii TaxID=868281 RepID=A0ABV7N5V8_9STAP